MIPVEIVRELLLDAPAGAEGSAHIAAASGLALLDDTLYVVSDDELYLAVFREMGAERGTTVHFLPGHLPKDYEKRKEEKPDLESLTPLEAFGPYEHGGLFALGSGSSPHRRHGAFASLKKDGSIDETIAFDAGPLFDALGERVPGLNLEGTAVVGDTLRVLQRGNEPGGSNAHIDLDLDRLRDVLASRGPLHGDLVGDIVGHDLGNIRGTELCFSDADTLPDGRIVFSASAESNEGETDGEVMGSAAGIMSPDGELDMLGPLDVTAKVEGLAARATEGGIEAFMVTDEDSPDSPTKLLRLQLDL